MIIWKPVIGFEGKYEVSNDGRVRSLERKVAVRNGVRTVPPKVLKHGYTVGYPCVVLGRGNTRMVHALVAEAFIGPRPKGFDVLHIDGSRDNNSAINLRYASRSENNRDIFVHGRRKVTPEALAAARVALDAGKTGASVARTLGVSVSQVSNIKHRRQYDNAIN